ncbi:hypothetical protein B0H19DRAFT_1136237 [Mycena capillaripes]|nr:hypothetical protein B0H19DRAFT_1136237 [Mycena capillaripes]
MDQKMYIITALFFGLFFRFGVLLALLAPFPVGFCCLIPALNWPKLAPSRPFSLIKNFRLGVLSDLLYGDRGRLFRLSFTLLPNYPDPTLIFDPSFTPDLIIGSDRGPIEC